jgi:hypothetical protein
MTATRAWIALIVPIAFVACRPSAPSAALTIERATDEMARCAFDDPSAMLAPNGQAALEAAIRRALRDDRYRFSVRAGRCASAIDEGLRARDPRGRTLAEAWDALLPLAQAQSPEDIALERAIRRVGVAWRAARTQ